MINGGIIKYNPKRGIWAVKKNVCPCGKLMDNCSIGEK